LAVLPVPGAGVDDVVPAAGGVVVVGGVAAGVDWAGQYACPASKTNPLMPQIVNVRRMTVSPAIVYGPGM
jgi:hypothetical protein